MIKIIIQFCLKPRLLRMRSSCSVKLHPPHSNIKMAAMKEDKNNPVALSPLKLQLITEVMGRGALLLLLLLLV